MESNRISPFGTAVYAVKAGAVPGALLAALGDFLSPKGLWVVPLLAGVVAVVILLLLLCFDGLRIWTMQRFGAGERQRLWRKPFTASAVFWTLLAFSVCGMGFAALSASKAEEGGVIAGNLQLAAALQQISGISERSLEEQTRTRKSVDDLVTIEQTGAAENPRVTLKNRGVDWSSSNLADALKNRDMETIDFFMQGGMNIGRAVPNASELAYYFREYSPDVAKVLIDHADEIPVRACLPSGLGSSGWLSDWLLDNDRIAFYSKICNKPEVRREIKERADALRSAERDLHQSNATVSQDRGRCISRLKRSFSIQDAIGLGFPPSIDGNATIDEPEERVAVGVQILLNRPGLDDATMKNEYGSLIERSCEESFVTHAVPAHDDLYDRVLAAF